MEMAAPDRTDNNNGLSGDPNSDAMSCSTAVSDATIKSHKGGGTVVCHSASKQ